MIFSSRHSRSASGAGMTLIEIMIALGIFGVVLTVCYGSSVALQRSFATTNAWTEARASQLRVLDSLAIDLRNATKIDFTSPDPTLITLSIPNRYSSYQPAGIIAGDPGPAAVPTPAPGPNEFGKIVYANTITVTYARSVDGKTITRSATGWSGSPATLPSRQIAMFPNTATVTFGPRPTIVITNTSGISMMTTTITTAPDDKNPGNQSALEGKVFLRELSIR